LQEVATGNRQLTEALGNIETFRDEDFAMAQLVLNEALAYQTMDPRILQRFPLNKVVTIDRRSGEVRVTDKISNEIFGRCANAEDVLRLEREKGDEADSARIKRLQAELVPLRAERDFIMALDERIRSLYKHEEETGARMGPKTVIRYYPSDLRTPDEMWGGDNGKIIVNQQNIDRIFSPETGRLAVLRKEMAGIAQESAKAQRDSSVDRKALRERQSRAQKEAEAVFAEAKRIALEMNPTSNDRIKNRFKYAAQVYINRLVAPELQRQNLVG
jgi:hypothetical protein